MKPDQIILFYLKQQRGTISVVTPETPQEQIDYLLATGAEKVAPEIGLNQIRLTKLPALRTFEYISLAISIDRR